MEQRPNSCSTLATSCGDNLNGNANNSPPDAFNFELSDLVDDLLVLAYADTGKQLDVMFVRWLHTWMVLGRLY